MTAAPLTLYSEPYGSTGNIGDNFRRLLGAPSIDALQTVIRESVQNIADAAKLGTGPEILIRLRKLTPVQMKALRELVLGDLPEAKASRKLLSETLSGAGCTVLEICDFGTTGLGGPTRSDRIPVGTKQTDFIDFLRNIGSARDTEHGGGTYGFGKVALYRASRCSTIIVDSLVAGASERRLIGCHVGRSFGIPRDGMLQRFTGRHWWGVADADDGIVDPATGLDAKALAEALGMPAREPDQTGTSIMILDFELEEELDAAASRIAETLLWNFWPRMMSDVPAPRRFRCRVEADGVEVTIPEPEQHPPLDLFCKAMRAARSGSGTDVRTVSSQRPARDLGVIALERGLRAARRPLVGSDSLMPSAARHIALMRPVELVVRYLEGAALPDENLEWAGVFLASADDEVERAFADAEPPAHDDWIPDSLPKGRAKTYVNVALRELRGIASDAGISDPVPEPQGGERPLARLAGRLGAVLGSEAGRGVVQPTRTSRQSRPRRARATVPVFARLELADDRRVAIFRTDVIQDADRSGAILRASAKVAVEGASVVRLEDGMEPPRILSITSADDGPEHEGQEYPLSGAEGSFEVRVMVPEGCAVTLDVDVSMRGGA